MVKLLFKNQSSIETVVDKLKNTLDGFGYTDYSSSDPNKTLNEIKTLREILNLIDTYDWKPMHSEYTTNENIDSGCANVIKYRSIKQVAVWEQNGEGQIRNHKVWNVKE